MLGTVKSYRSNGNPKTAYSRQLTKSGVGVEKVGLRLRDAVRSQVIDVLEA